MGGERLERLLTKSSTLLMLVHCVLVHCALVLCTQYTVHSSTSTLVLCTLCTLYELCTLYVLSVVQAFRPSVIIYVQLLFYEILDY